ncbi:MAG: hypothetical protein R3D58_13180 [Saprospiraceae bacterium]
MTAKPTSLFSGKRLWLWIAAFFGTVILAMIVVYLIKKSKSPATGPKQQPPLPSAPAFPSVPTTSTPPIVPSDSVSQGNNQPVDVYNANWAYVQEVAWKMYDTYFDRNSYKCEVTNGIIEMGENDLRALVQLYKQWYNRSLKTDYCQKITSSGCWSSWWDDKPAEACSRLKQLN